MLSLSNSGTPCNGLRQWYQLEHGSMTTVSTVPSPADVFSLLVEVFCYCRCVRIQFENRVEHVINFLDAGKVCLHQIY